MIPASQYMYPLNLRLQERAVAENVFAGQRGLEQIQRSGVVFAKMQLIKLFATTSFPTPITGRKLNPQPTQQRIPQPGRHGGLFTTFYQFLIIQLTNIFLKIKYPRRQQNSTSVQPTIRIIPTPQPIIRKCKLAQKILTDESTFVPRYSVNAQSNRSITGQPQMSKKIALIAERLLQQMLQRVGRKRQQLTQRKAICIKGISVLQAASLVRLSPELLMIATSNVRMTYIPQNIYSLQTGNTKTVNNISTANRIMIRPMQVPYLMPFPSSLFSIKLQEYTIKGSFQSSQEQTKLIATDTVTSILTVVNILVESTLVQDTTSTASDTLQPVEQQFDD